MASLDDEDLDLELNDSVGESSRGVIMQLSQTLSENARKLAKIASRKHSSSALLRSYSAPSPEQGLASGHSPYSSVSKEGEVCCILLILRVPLERSEFTNKVFFSEILARANIIQKALKRGATSTSLKAKPKDEKDDHVVVSFHSIYTNDFSIGLLCPLFTDQCV